MNKNIAIYIDAENISYKYYNIFMNKINNINGNIMIKNVYLDWSKNNNYKWDKIVKKNGLTPIIVPQISNYKNSTDLKITVDIMEHLFSLSHIDIYCIISSDLDFSHVVEKIKKYGKIVYGYGMRDANIYLQQIFHKYYVLNNNNYLSTFLNIDSSDFDYSDAGNSDSDNLNIDNTDADNSDINNSDINILNTNNLDIKNLDTGNSDINNLDIEKINTDNFSNVLSNKKYDKLEPEFIKKIKFELNNLLDKNTFINISKLKDVLIKKYNFNEKKYGYNSISQFCYNYLPNYKYNYYKNSTYIKK